MLGLVGGPLIILSGTAAMLGIIEPGWTWQNLAAVPEFFWELGLGHLPGRQGLQAVPLTAELTDDER